MTSPQRRLQRIAAGFNMKARRYHARGQITWLMLLQKGDRCAYCPTTMSVMDGTFDHAIPLDRGGPNTPENIVRCCMDCQRRKFTKTPQEYDQHRELRVTCALPGCDRTYQPRYAEWLRGQARYCSRSHAAKSRWV